MGEDFQANESSLTPGLGAGAAASAGQSVHRFASEAAEPIFLSDELQPPLRWNEGIGVASLIILSDLTIYRGQGFGGYALLFLLAPLLFWISSSQRQGGFSMIVLGAMLTALVVKMIWCGSAALVATGFFLIVLFAMVILGRRLYLLDTASFLLLVPAVGIRGLGYYARQLKNIERLFPRTAWISFGLPIVALTVFGGIFIRANPDFVTAFGEGWQRVVETIAGWFKDFPLEPLEVVFWVATLWAVLGLLRDEAAESTAVNSPSTTTAKDKDAAATEAFLFAAARNTLVAVILLFGVYLVFEFGRLWFRDFPAGFYYSGFAHEGAAWLTVALALATVTLSLIFRGRLLNDPRMGTLRRLAWVWSAENMILTLAIYNRLFIYIEFNGMSRMRIVGLYGISAVVVGFALVLWKISRNHSFLWLVRRQIWTLAIALYLLALTPLDTIVVSYNVRQILSGNPAPSVQVSVHSISAEGILWLEPLLNSDDEIIREGVRALLAEHHAAAEMTAKKRERLGWSTFQLADHLALKRFRQQSTEWRRYQNHEARRQALDKFHEYAYQWY